MHRLEGLCMYNDADLGLWTVLAAACSLLQIAKPESYLLVKSAAGFCTIHKRRRWPSNASWDEGLSQGQMLKVAVACRPIYNQTLLINWTAQSHNSTLYQNASALVAGELITQCSSISPRGTLVFTAPGQGYFLGKLSMSFWAQYATSTPDLQLSLATTDSTLPQVHLCIFQAAALGRACTSMTSVSERTLLSTIQNTPTERAAVIILLHLCV